MKSMVSDTGRVLGAGIGTIGPMDRAKGIIGDVSGFAAPGWSGTNLKKLFEDEWKCPVFIDNGAKTGLLCEYLFGAGKGRDSTVYINCGIGIRMASITAGSLVRTVNDNEDAFAHMVANMDGRESTCGKRGCIESYSSMDSIVSAFRAKIMAGAGSALVACQGNGASDIFDIGFEDISKAAKEGDETSRSVIAAAAEVFGTGLANYISLQNPGIVILSGPLIKISDLFLNDCKETAEKRCLPKGRISVPISRGGSFGDIAIASGAAAMVVEHYLNSKVLSEKEGSEGYAPD
jgi:predicted NBD/HSP70 family sugar kinase